MCYVHSIFLAAFQLNRMCKLSVGWYTVYCMMLGKKYMYTVT